jgi:hypothetical protein
MQEGSRAGNDLARLLPPIARQRSRGIASSDHRIFSRVSRSRLVHDCWLTRVPVPARGAA